MAEVDNRKRAEGTRSFGVSAFPIEQWNEWDADCKKNFGDCRWLKMWNDHLRSKDSIKYELLVARIEELEAALQVLLEKPQEEKKNVVKTFNQELK